MCFSQLGGNSAMGSITEPVWLKILVDIATVVAALAAWWSARAARDAALATKQANLDAFLPLLKVEDRNSSLHHINLYAINVGRGPMYRLKMIEPTVEKECYVDV